MEHPLIPDLNDLTVDELSGKISELNRKLTISMQSGNAHMCNQIRMAIESYQNKYQEKLLETYSQQFNSQQLADKIQIK